MPGPAPKPVEMKRRLGNPGGKALPVPAVLLPTSGTPPPVPATLGRRGREAWRRLWSVGGAWLSPVTDWGVMLRLCAAWDEWWTLRGVIAQEGLFAEGYNKQPVTHPAVKQLRTLEAEMRRLEGVCGFTPADRSRLGMAEVQRVSKLGEFMQQWGGGRGQAG